MIKVLNQEKSVLFKQMPIGSKFVLIKDAERVFIKTSENKGMDICSRENFLRGFDSEEQVYHITVVNITIKYEYN